jgi:hypothetical protein
VEVASAIFCIAIEFSSIARLLSENDCSWFSAMTLRK